MAAFARLATGRLLSPLQPALCWRSAAAAGMVPAWHKVQLVGHEAGPYRRGTSVPQQHAPISHAAVAAPS